MRVGYLCALSLRRTFGSQHNIPCFFIWNCCSIFFFCSPSEVRFFFLHLTMYFSIFSAPSSVLLLSHWHEHGIVSTVWHLGFYFFFCLFVSCTQPCDLALRRRNGFTSDFPPLFSLFSFPFQGDSRCFSLITSITSRKRVGYPFLPLFLLNTLFNLFTPPSFYFIFSLVLTSHRLSFSQSPQQQKFPSSTRGTSGIGIGRC